LVYIIHTQVIFTHPLFTEFSDFIGIRYYSKVPLVMDMELVLLINDPSECLAHNL
jgi:hypothetical protein